MFGGYTELFAYGQESDKEEDQNINISSSEMAYYLSSFEKCLSFGGFKTWPCPREDFIILAECSETCGPIPILTVPSNVSAVDLNEFTIQLLSSDYQGLGSGDGIPHEDTQLLKPDAMKDIHTMINYLVLLDSQARGFVRPLCIAYVTPDKQKLMQNAPLLLKALSQASNFLKEYNKKLFLHEAQRLIEDLEYTKAEYMKELSEELCSKLELLESTLKEVQHSYHSICHWKIDEKIERTNKRFNDCLQNFLDNSKTDLKSRLMHYRSSNSLHKPSIVRLPIHRNFESGLRPHSEICLNGFPLAVYQLYITYKFFRRKNENIILGLKDKEFGGQLLHFGACLRPSCSPSERGQSEMSYTCVNIVPDIPQRFTILEDGNFHHLDCAYIDLLLSANQASLRKMANIETTYEEMEIQKQYDLEPFFKSRNEKLKNNMTSQCLWHGFSLGGLWDVIDEYHADGSEYYFHEMLQKFSFTQHILYSLLIGRPIAIIGIQDHGTEIKIRALVKCLGLLAPRTRRKPLWMELWRTTVLCEKDIDNLAIVGLGCTVNHNIDSLIPSSSMAYFTVLDVTCFSFTGPYYSGCLLSDVDKKLKCLPQNGPVFSVLISVLANIEMKVQFWQQCQKTLENTAGASDHFLNSEFSKHDFHIIQKLGECLEEA